MRGRYKSARTLLVWRRNALSARVKALADAIATARGRVRRATR
jgi:hypothetical protein